MFPREEGPARAVLKQSSRAASDPLNEISGAAELRAARAGPLLAVPPRALVARRVSRYLLVGAPQALRNCARPGQVPSSRSPLVRSSLGGERRPFLLRRGTRTGEWLGFPQGCRLSITDCEGLSAVRSASICFAPGKKNGVPPTGGPPFFE